MNEEGAVTRCQDAAGDIAFAPTPATDSLADRVLSLIAADLFARPGDFEGETLCSCCGGIVMGRSLCCSGSRYDVPSSSVIVKPMDTVPVPLAG